MATIAPYDRARELERLQGGVLDALVVGAGINGAVATRALAAQGVSVGLIDAADYASATSQESSNLVWGGFKYLEGYELGLVSGLCRSRNELASAYPTRVRQLRFMAALGETSPYSPAFATAGSYAYWAIGRFYTDRPRHLRRSQIQSLEPAVRTGEVRGGIEYSDYYLPDNDARFVFDFVADAHDAGAVTLNYVAMQSAERVDGMWRVAVQDALSGATFEVSAKVLINATGPHVTNLNAGLGVANRRQILLSKGIHLVVPRLHDSDRVLAFYDDTKRLFYVIPMANRCVIGTTDTRVGTADVSVTDDDRRWVLDQANARLALPRPLTEADIISERCGVRSLIVEPGEQDVQDHDWTSLSRKHVIEVDRKRAVVSILGGKLSDCLNVGRGVVRAVGELGFASRVAPKPWFGERPADEHQAFRAAAQPLGLGRPCEVEPDASRGDLLWRRYGARAYEVLDRIREDPASQAPIGPGTDISSAELDLIASREQVVRAEDLLRRRTKLALIHREADLAATPGVVAAISVIAGQPAADAFVAAHVRPAKAPATG